MRSSPWSRIRSAFSRLNSHLSNEGSAIILVLIFASVLLFLAPIYAEMIKNSANQNAQNRASMGKRIIMKNVETLLNSPSALNASYQLAGSGAENGSAPYKVNTCLKQCLEGSESAGGSGITSCTDVDTTFIAISAGAATNYVGNQWEKFCSSYIPGASGLTALWHPMSLYSAAELTYTGATPTGGTIVAGQNSTNQYPNQSNSYATQGILYSYDGTPCSLPTAACPLVVMAYFHPVCPGDTLLNATPSTSGHINPPSTLFPIVCNQAVAIQVAYTISRNPSFTGKVVGALADYDSRRDPLNPTTLRSLTELPIVPIFPSSGGSILPTTSILAQPQQVVGSFRAGTSLGICARFTNGLLNCWLHSSPGAAAYDTTYFPSKVALVGGDTPEKIFAGANNELCAITGGTKRVQCWTSALSPYVISNGVTDLVGVTKIGMGGGGQKNCAVASGQVWCWTQGTLTASQVTPFISTTVIDVCATPQGVICAVNDAAGGGKIQCWSGSNNDCEYGTGSVHASIASPQAGVVVDDTAFAGSLPQELACGAASVCARLANGLTYCWGNYVGAVLGFDPLTPDVTIQCSGANVDVPRPITPVASLTGATAFSNNGGSFGTTCAASNVTNNYWCWGYNGGAFAKGSTGTTMGVAYGGATNYSTSQITSLFVHSATGGATSSVGCGLESLSGGFSLVHCSGYLVNGLGGAGSFNVPVAATSTLAYPVGPWRY